MSNSIQYFDTACIRGLIGKNQFFVVDELQEIEIPITVDHVAVYGGNLEKWDVKVISKIGATFQYREKFPSPESAKALVDALISLNAETKLVDFRKIVF
jgi:hypothetical protein